MRRRDRWGVFREGGGVGNKERAEERSDNLDEIECVFLSLLHLSAPCYPLNSNTDRFARRSVAINFVKFPTG